MKTTDILVIGAVMIVFYFAFRRRSPDENDEAVDESLGDDSGFGWGRPAGGHTRKYLKPLWDCKKECKKLNKPWKRTLCQRTCNCRHGNPLRCCTKHCREDNRGKIWKRNRCIRKCKNGGLG